MSLDRVAPVGKPFKVFVVYKGDDERSSGHPDTSLVFTDKNVATEVAKKRGWYGGDAHVGEHLAIKDSEGMYWLLDKQISDINRIRMKHESEIKEKALKKLSAEERRILGL